MRYAPDRAFPPYAYLPGRDPHPTRDPEGHSYGAEEPDVPYRPPEEWSSNDAYLFGVDLYNEGYLWEAHEAWEELWHVSKPDRHQALFLQALIQCAAACLKIPMGQPRGLERLSALGTEKLLTVAKEADAAHDGHYMGLDVPRFAADLRSFAASTPASIEDRPRIELDSPS